MSSKSPLVKLLYAVRDLRSRRLFDALREHVRGEVLDVGGWDFFLTARRQGVQCTRWTTLEPDPTRLPDVDAPEFETVHGDGCAMEFPDASYDSVLNVQVLEHVLEPLKMVAEMARVLRPGGKLVLLVPQTPTTHLAPHYFGGFSRYWLEAALPRAGLEIVTLEPLGGVWSSMASHLVYFFFQAARFPGMSDARVRRGPLFWLLLPFMAAWALLAIPVCLVFSLGDLREEPNNILVVARKGGERTSAGASSV